MNTEIDILKQEFEEIESSMVQDEVDKNDLNCITDVNEWLETINQIDIASKNKKGTGPNPDRVVELRNHWDYHYNFDYEIINNASGYITAAVFTYKTKAEASASMMFKSLQEMKDFLKDKKYLLYMTLASIAAERVGIVDNGIYTIIPNRPLFGTPEIRYIFRGHILE